MPSSGPELQHCALCRFLRGLAFGGIGAAVAGLPVFWLGADDNTVILSAFLGTLVVGGFLNRRLGS